MMNRVERIALFKKWIPTQKGENKKMLHGLGVAKQYLKHLEQLNRLPIVAQNFGAGFDILGDAAIANFQDVVDAIKTDPGFDRLNNAVNFVGVYSAALEKYASFVRWIDGTPDDNEFWDCLMAGEVAQRAKDFLRWLPTQVSVKTKKKFSKKTAQNYEERLRCAAYRGFNFFAIDTSAKLTKVRAILDATTDYKKHIVTDRHSLSNALEQYANYLMAKGV